MLVTHLVNAKYVIHLLNVRLPYTLDRDIGLGLLFLLVVMLTSLQISLPRMQL